MTKKALLLLLTLLIAFQASSSSTYAYEDNELIELIKANTYKDVVLNPEKDEEFQILVRVATNNEIKQLIKIASLKYTTTDEKALAIRALGTIKEHEAIDTIKNALLKEKDPNIVYASAWSLIQIGGDKNFEFIVENFSKITKDLDNKDKVFRILLYLSEKYKNKSVLAYSTKFLNITPDHFYKALYLFCVFGRTLSSEEVLIQELNQKDDNIKLNAVRILGEWYASPNAVEPFEKILKNEKDPEIRKSIIKGLETIGTNDAVSVIKQVINKPLNNDEKQFARESLSIMNRVIHSVEKEVEGNNYHPDQRTFQKELSKLMSSKGNFGSYSTLEKNAEFKDIFLLDRLREVIMLRSNKEALEDYEKVTRIITRVRLKLDLIK